MRRARRASDSLCSCLRRSSLHASRRGGRREQGEQPARRHPKTYAVTAVGSAPETDGGATCDHTRIMRRLRGHGSLSAPATPRRHAPPHGRVCSLWGDYRVEVSHFRNARCVCPLVLPAGPAGGEPAPPLPRHLPLRTKRPRLPGGRGRAGASTPAHSRNSAVGTFPAVSRRPPPARAGFLTKRGHVRKSWKLRFFEIVDGRLVYSEGKGGKAKGQVRALECWERASLALPALCGAAAHVRLL